MDELEKLLRDGIISQAFIAERNLCIYKNVADNYDFINKQGKSQDALYGFIQTSAQDNFILALSKLFDKISKNNPTKCVEIFLSKVRRSIPVMKRIVETSQLRTILTNYDCPNEFVDSIARSPQEFYTCFCNYFDYKYTDPVFQESLKTLRGFRDKAIAHNETKEGSINIQDIRRLLDFAEELYSIFGMAYSSTIFGDIHSLKHNAEMEAYFVNSTIEQLKERARDKATATEYLK